MGKLIVRLIIFIAIYIAAYAGFRATGFLQTGTVPSEATPGTVVTKVLSTDKDSKKLLEKVFMPCCSAEAIVHNLGKKGEKRDAEREAIEKLTE